MIGRHLTFDIRAVKGPVACQKATQLDSGHFLERGSLSHHAEYLLLRKLPRRRGVIRKQQILILVIPPKKVDRVGGKNKLLGRIPTTTKQGRPDTIEPQMESAYPDSGHP